MATTRGAKEIRTLTLPFRVERSEGQPPRIMGYAARFNELSEVMWGFREKISPGAFIDALKTSDVRALWNHDPNHVLGRAKAGTLKVWEDDVGLRYEVVPPDAQWAQDLLRSMERGDVDQSSFAFTVAKDEWNDDEEMPVRTIVAVERLYDVSPVTYPAYPSTTSGVRSLEDVLEEHIAVRKTVAPAAPQIVGTLRRRLELMEQEGDI